MDSVTIYPGSLKSIFFQLKIFGKTIEVQGGGRQGSDNYQYIIIHTKHCQDEVQESISGHHFQNTRKLDTNYFQYHRDVIYSV